MDNRKSDPQPGAGHPANPNVSTLGNPLDLIHKDHLREREICDLIDRIAEAGTPKPEDLSQVLSYLAQELPLLLEDEEEDLFPLLRRRCEHEDEIEKAINQLTAGHRHAYEETSAVMAVLSTLETGSEHLSDTQRASLACYVTHARRHLILLNAIILPFARLRLTESDLETLTLRMMQRRGLDRLADLDPDD